LDVPGGGAVVPVSAVVACDDTALQVGCELGEVVFDLPDGVADARGDGLAGSFGGSVGERAGPVADAADVSELVEECLAFDDVAGEAFGVVVLLGLGDVLVEVGEALPVGVKGLTVGEASRGGRTVGGVDEVEGVDVAAGVGEQEARSVSPLRCGRVARWSAKVRCQTAPWRRIEATWGGGGAVVSAIVSRWRSVSACQRGAPSRW
jgi:hypothetical protein